MTAFDDAEQGAFTPEVEDHCETIERNNGRIERRIGTVLGGPNLCEWGADPGACPGLRCLIRACPERTSCRQHSVRYYISSRPVDAESWTSSAVIGASRIACTAPWTCSPGRMTAACARGMPLS